MLPTTSTVAQANSILEYAHGQISRAIRPHLRDGLFDLEQSSIYDQVCALRFLKKFQEPTAEGSKERKRLCYEKWLNTESEGRNVCFSKIPLSAKSVLYRARELLHEWFGDFQPGSDIEFTPGESFEPHRGRTSVYHKLRYRSHWTCTYDAFDDFAKLVYHTQGLKRCAKALMRKRTRKEYKELYSMHESAFGVFKHLLEVDVVTLVHGGRLSSVYKNNEIDRAIIVEATGNMLLQRTVAQPIRSTLATLNNDLSIGQHVHRARIQSPDEATIDFSEASDRVWLAVVENLFPGVLARYLKRYRSDMILVDDSYHLLNKLGSMGCGFTFEVMTSLLLAIARVLDPTATVYGDDVIIKNGSAAQFIYVCEAIGLTVNVKKSFVSKTLRESCGAYYDDRCGYITAYDMHWCASWRDVTVAANKIKAIVDAHPDKLGSCIAHILQEAYNQLLALAPAFARGPDVGGIDCGFIHDVQSHRAQKRCKVSRDLYHYVKSRCDQYFGLLCYSASYSCVKVESTSASDAFAKHNRKYRDCGPRYLAALLAGQYAPVTTRGTEIVTQKLLIAHPDFGVLLYKEIDEHLKKLELKKAT